MLVQGSAESWGNLGLAYYINYLSLVSAPAHLAFICHMVSTFYFGTSGQCCCRSPPGGPFLLCIKNNIFLSILPDETMKDFAELQNVEVEDLVLLHEKDVHYKVGADSDLAR